MDQIIKALLAIYTSICGMYNSGYGDPGDTQAGDLALPIIAAGQPNDWKPLLTMTYPSILYLRNTSVDPALLQEIQIHWNKQSNVGAKIAYDKGIVFDNVMGTVYVKSLDTTKTAGVNFLAVARKHTAQNI